MSNSSKKQEEDQAKVIPYWSKIEYETFARVTRRATPEEIGTAMQRYMAVWAGTADEAEAYDGLSAKSADILDLKLENLNKSRASFARQSKVGKENREKVGKGKSKSKKAPEPEQVEAEQAEAEEDEPEQAGPIKYAEGTDEHFIAHLLAQWIANNAQEGRKPHWSEKELDNWAAILHRAASGGRNHEPIPLVDIYEALHWATTIDTPDKYDVGASWAAGQT